MNRLRIYISVVYVATVLAIGGWLFPAYADTTTSFYSPRAIQEALSVADHTDLYKNRGRSGLGFSSGFFSGRASGVDAVSSLHGMSYDNSVDHSAELEGDQRVYALLIDGHYDFNYDQVNSSALRPYVSGGLGVAHYGQSPTSGNNLAQNREMIPLFRVGGGVTYRLGHQWDLSLDYKAGFSGASDQLFTGRNQQPVDLQILNMGMHYQF